jgi:hypothetical protein
MLDSSGKWPETPTRIGGSNRPGREENFPLAFGRAARALWPAKTAFVLATIAGTSDRAAKDWLSGKVPAPAIVIAAIVVEITKRN